VIFRALWTIAVVVDAVAVYFFVLGIADGSVSSFNLGLWAVLLLGATAVTGGSLWLKKSGRPGLASAVAALLAVPGVLAVLLVLAMLIVDPHWT